MRRTRRAGIREKFCRSSGTDSFPPLFPALKRWAIVAMPLQGGAMALRPTGISHALLENIFANILGDISSNMDFHLIYGVVEIAAGIPRWGGGLGAALAVGGSRLDGVVAALGGFP